MTNKNIISANLTLQDGTVFRGISFGAEKSTVGEVVFNTAMSGYPESLTDPSYMGQIGVMTYPMIGNYGIPGKEKDKWGIEKFWESPKIHMNGIIVSNYSQKHSHWNSERSLGDWLKDEGVAGIAGIDTRALTKHIREYGSMTGVISIGDDTPPTHSSLDEKNLVALASCKEALTYGNGPRKVVLLDCGVKNNIIRQIIDPDFTVIRVPWNYDFTQLGSIDGVLISNGPGNPEMCGEAVVNIKKAIKAEIPIFGICMGNQLLALAAGAKIYKLKYGHRGHNQPVRMFQKQRCFITSQNHSFAVDQTTLPKDWEPSFINLNDGTNEGIRHKTLPFLSVQFHPEACGGTLDTLFLFDQFKQLIKCR